MRQQVLQLYRQSLRTARMCPQATHRDMMRSYVRLRFRDLGRLADEAHVARHLQEGWDEVLRMRAMIDMKRAEAGGSEPSATARAVCGCGNVFLPGARFCAACGAKRPEAAT